MEQTTRAEIESGITEKMAVVKIEGQEFELETVLADDDKMLKTVLQPHFSSVENANITREVRNGQLIVSIVKRAQHKGAANQRTELSYALRVFVQ
jgi:hypothetical protein